MRQTRPGYSIYWGYGVGAAVDDLEVFPVFCVLYYGEIHYFQ